MFDTAEPSRAQPSVWLAPWRAVEAGEPLLSAVFLVGSRATTITLEQPEEEFDVLYPATCVCRAAGPAGAGDTLHRRRQRCTDKAVNP